DRRQRLAGIADEGVGMAACESLAEAPRRLDDAAGGIDVERRSAALGEIHEIDAVHEQAVAARLDIARDLPGTGGVGLTHHCGHRCWNALTLPIATRWVPSLSRSKARERVEGRGRGTKGRPLAGFIRGLP